MRAEIREDKMLYIVAENPTEIVALEKISETETLNKIHFDYSQSNFRNFSSNLDNLSHPVLGSFKGHPATWPCTQCRKNFEESEFQEFYGDCGVCENCEVKDQL